MDLKRASFASQFGRLFEAKRASFKIEGVKNNYKSRAKPTKSPLPNGKGYDCYDISIKKIEKRESTFEPIRSLEPKHILFYYRVDCLSLQRRRSGLRQVIKADKMPIRK